MRKTFPGIRAVRVAAVLAFGLVGLTMVGPVPVVQASAGDAQAREIVRLVNGARATAGKRALNIDVNLAKVATDGAIPCPDTSGTIAGRSRDFAAFGNMSHDLRNCGSSAYQLSGTMFVDQLRAKMGYGGASVGEIIGVNGGFGTGKYTFSYGGWSTYTYATTGHIVAGWLNSGQHRPIIMGNYSRVGCGAWWQGAGTIYYDCIFATGGPGGLIGAPSTSPFGPMPTPAPTAVPTAAPTHSPTEPPSAGGPGTGTGTGATGSTTAQPTPTPTPSPTATPSPTPSSTQSAGAGSSGGAAGLLLPTSGASYAAAGSDTMPPSRQPPARDSLALGSLAGLVVGLAGLGLLFLRKRTAARSLL